jgi:hypothetical protein
MEVLYGLLLFGVAVMLLAGVVEGVLAVSRQPVWQSTRFPTRAVLTAVVSIDRRDEQLPFVGVDRRQFDVEEAPVRKAA